MTGLSSIFASIKTTILELITGRITEMISGLFGNLLG